MLQHILLLLSRELCHDAELSWTTEMNARMLAGVCPTYNEKLFQYEIQ